MSENTTLHALIDFDCAEPECEHSVQFNLLELRAADGRVSCSHCHRLYVLERPFLEKLEKLRVLVLAVRDAEDILGDCNVAISVPGGEVKVPYRLMLTRLNTLVTVECSGVKMDFHFRVEPLNATAFR